MSITKSFITFGCLPPPNNSQTFHSSETRKSTSLCSSSSTLAALKNIHQTRVWDSKMRLRKCCRSKGRFIVRSVVQPGAPPPSPFNLINWILGIAITVVLPFFSNKWTSLLRIKNEVETVVEIAEEIVVAVEKVAEGVEKAAENLAEDLPEGGGLRKAVDFVEHVAERANKDAHIVGDFIDKVQEVEEKVEDYVESLVEGATTNHEHHGENHQENEAQKDEEDPPNQEENIN
ncbi:hypothetical protein C2S51_007880 [Perilla frutescens var. frutescens]|nr:hypothetical protein C2S51_007880 [Perilla frutescens var. frutescens]